MGRRKKGDVKRKRIQSIKIPKTYIYGAQRKVSFHNKKKIPSWVV